MPEHLPAVYRRFIEEYPQVIESHHRLTDTLHDAGPLETRERRLAKLGIAIGQASPGAVRSHVRKALNEGLAAEEIQHVAVLAISTAGFPLAVAAYGWIKEVLDQEARG